MDFPRIPATGSEWIVDAFDCSVERLRDLSAVRDVCEQLLLDLDLKVVGKPQWHQFPGPAGVTGLYLLSESHLACHTYPEHRLATFSLYCCRAQSDWRWDSELRYRLDANSVSIRQIARGGAASATVVETHS